MHDSFVFDSFPDVAAEQAQALSSSLQALAATEAKLRAAAQQLAATACQIHNSVSKFDFSSD